MPSTIKSIYASIKYICGRPADLKKVFHANCQQGENCLAQDTGRLT